jgi:hypothetical protein
MVSVAYATLGIFMQCSLEAESDLSPGDQLTAHDPGIDLEEIKLECGRRSMFLWLRFLGKQVTYDEIARVVPIAEGKGTSLAALADCCRHWNIPVKILQIGNSDLSYVSFPAIAHIWLDAHAASDGHYIVILNVTPDYVTFADGVAGNVERMTRNNFCSVWSGYLLVENNSDATVMQVALWLLGCMILLMGGFIVGDTRKLVRSRSRMASLACLLLLLSGGCGASDLSVNASSNKKAAKPVAVAGIMTSSRKQDLGLIKVGQEARATFTLSNTTDHPLRLTMGRPSCGCMNALLNNDVVDPHESVNLEVVLTGGKAYVGPREGSVTVGIEGTDDVLLFTAKGMIEGMRTTSYSLSYPEDLKGFVPDSLLGEIVVAVGNTDSEVAIRSVEVTGLIKQAIHLGEPVLHPLEQVGAYSRCKFEIPIRLDGRPETGTYPMLLTYSIDNRVGDHGVPLRVFPRAENGK